MLVLITYDVNTESKTGKKRLNKVAKICVDYGQRVQNSVFECDISPAQLIKIKNQLEKVIDPEKDSIRFYLLGKNWERKIETIGINNTYNSQKNLLYF